MSSQQRRNYPKGKSRKIPCRRRTKGGPALTRGTSLRPQGLRPKILSVPTARRCPPVRRVELLAPFFSPSSQDWPPRKCSSGRLTPNPVQPKRIVLIDIGHLNVAADRPGLSLAHPQDVT